MRTLIALSLAAHLTLPHSEEPVQISRLDQCIQQRFLGRKSFGMERIAPLDFHRVRQFRPENDTEQAIVNELAQKGYEVALYLAGRNVLSALATPSLLPLYRYSVQGPAFITRFANPADLPRPESLLEDSRAALEVFKTNEARGYDLQRGQWTMAMRPLRAANAACIQCHNATGANVKIGDPLGVVMYLYRRP